MNRPFEGLPKTKAPGFAGGYLLLGAREAAHAHRAEPDELEAALAASTGGRPVRTRGT